jgi:hypothetical protein
MWCTLILKQNFISIVVKKNLFLLAAGECPSIEWDFMEFVKEWRLPNLLI